MGKSLIAEIDRFVEKHGLSDSTFGLKALKNSHFLHELRAGARQPRRSTLKKVRDFMARVEADPTELQA